MFLISMLFLVSVGGVCATNIIKNDYHFNNDGSFTGAVVKITNSTNNYVYEEYTEVTIYRGGYESCDDWNSRVLLLKNDVENNKILKIGDYL